MRLRTFFPALSAYLHLLLNALLFAYCVHSLLVATTVPIWPINFSRADFDGSASKYLAHSGVNFLLNFARRRIPFGRLLKRFSLYGAQSKINLWIPVCNQRDFLSRILSSEIILRRNTKLK